MRETDYFGENRIDQVRLFWGKQNPIYPSMQGNIQEI
jgi:hypothetical protein